MQIKTIQKNIEAKLEEWLKTISDEPLRNEVKKSILVSGGCIVSMLLNEPVNDFDIYLMDIDVLKRLATYYTVNIEGIEILDTHLGSGSSAIAAHDMEFEFVGCEIDSDYHAAAMKRFSEQTRQLKFL